MDLGKSELTKLVVRSRSQGPSVLSKKKCMVAHVLEKGVLIEFIEREINYGADISTLIRLLEEGKLRTSYIMKCGYPIFEAFGIVYLRPKFSAGAPAEVNYMM